MFRSITPLTERSIPGVAEILASVFADDSAYAYLIADPAERVGGLRDFFARNLRTHLPYRCTYVLWAEGDALRPLGTVTLRPPQGIPISLWTMLRRGLLPFAWRHGPDAVRRLLQLKTAYDDIEAEIAEHRPHHFVHMMAVAPAHQGQGLGTRLLNEVVMPRIDGSPHPTVLTTHKERNVVFYRRAGFETVERRELKLPQSEAAHDVWCMRR